MTSQTVIEAFIINYNGKNTVLSTIESLCNSEDVKISVTVIDDHSTDESPGLIKNQYPGIPIHILPVNTKRANLLRNKALSMATTDYVFITDNDLKYDKRCIPELLKMMETDEKIATCTPRLMHWDQPNKVYTAGTKVHFIGAAVSDQRDKLYVENKMPSVNSGGGISLIRRSAVLKAGGFDENLMIGWGDDGEFYQRLMRAGYKCIYVPSAFALHENKLDGIGRKFRVAGQAYNRWVFILSHYSIPLIILLIPVFILYEILEGAFVSVKGMLFQHLKGTFLVLKNFRAVLEKRRSVQKLKVVSDKEILFSGDIYIAPALVEKHKFIKLMVSPFCALLNFYWRIIRKIVP